MKKFQFYQASNLQDACRLLHENRDSVRVIAGGTDLVLELNEGRSQPQAIVNIRGLRELKYVRRENGLVHIGAMTTFAELDRNAYIRERVKVLHTAASNMGSPQIRNLATVGGNLVNASVAGDSLGSFIALDATVALQSVRGRREMKLTEFYGGQRKTAIEPDELMAEIYFDEPDAYTATSFVKLAKREALAIVVIDACCVIKRDENNVCTGARVAVGAVGRYPFRIGGAEAYLTGRPLSRDTCMATLPLISQAVYESIRTRPSVTYKRESVKGIAEQMYGEILADFQLS